MAEPSSPMSRGSALRARLANIDTRKALEADLASGATTERLSKSYRLKTITLRFNDRGSGLVFTPPAKSVARSTILFSQITGVHKMPNNSAIRRKAKLGPFKHCIELQSRDGISWVLVSNTLLDRDTWYNFFLHHVAKCSATRRTNPVDAFIETQWTAAKKRHGDYVTYAEVIAILRQAFGDVPVEVIEERFKEADHDKNIRLDYEEFCELFRSFYSRPELHPIIAEFVKSPEEGATRQEFGEFLRVQGDLGEKPSVGGFSTGSSSPNESSSSYADALFDHFGLPPDGRLSTDEFEEFLVSAHFNSAIDPRHRRGADPMTFPLKDYFINSSHNTYLTGDQLRSDSSTDRYRDVLMSGCRCVEIDCWNGPDGDPIVYHGHTATSRIRFADVIRVIGEYAFKSESQGSAESTVNSWNPRAFPVILSLEVHTGETQCARMAAILRSVLGSKLCLPGDVKEMTPANLKGKILVKWKASNTDDDDEKDVSGSGIRPDRAVEPSEHVSNELSGCVTIGSFKTKNWGDDATAPTYVQSYVETAIEQFLANSPSEFAAQNTRMLSRVYPAGLRVTSSNYDPMPAWAMGAQMAALNFQTKDKYMAVNSGFFGSQNGGCGYVLKPLYLRDPSRAAADGRGGANFAGSVPFKLTLKLISGAHIGEAYAGREGTVRSVRASIHGLEDEESGTSAASGSSFHTFWGETCSLRGNTFELDVLHVRLLATDDDGRHDIGEACVPVRVLRQGYRAIPLQHPKTLSPLAFGTLLCKITISFPKA